MIITGLALLLLLYLIYNNLKYRLRERAANRLAQQRNRRLALILRTSGVRVWTYDIDTRLFTWMSDDGTPERQYTSDEFSLRYSREDYRRLQEAMQQMARHEKENITLELQATDVDAGETEARDYTIALSVLQYRHGQPAIIIGTKSDTTEERLKQRRAKDMKLRYETIFNSSMIDMVYYDEEGNIADMNKRACETFQMDLEETIKEKVNLRIAIEEPNLDLNNFEYYHVTEFLNTRGEARDIKSRKVKDRMCYEMQLVPVFDSSHKLLCVYGTGRDVTEVADAYGALRESIHQTQEANEALAEYIRNINYVLRVGGVRMVNYSPENHMLTVYSGINQVQLSLTQTRALGLIDSGSQKTAMRAMNSMDAATKKAFDAKVETRLRVKGHPLVLHFNFIPTCDAEGNVTAYFGMCRDVSEMAATEKQLQQETVKAQEVEELKNAFMRNMSYEIRTPLSTVVGFAELFEMPHTPEDEELFIREIKDNSAHLLHLINDILFLSRLDAHMIEINPKPTDLAQTFEGLCQMAWANDRQEGVRYIVENRYKHLVVDIDTSNLGHLVEQIVQNAVSHTQSGYVRVSYEYVVDKLVATVEDTGEGIAADTLSSIFERFNTNSKGTGLGLPICKELAEQMGGTVDISSRPGKGTTVWITLSCQATLIERKADV